MASTVEEQQSAPAERAERVPPRLQSRYRGEIVPALREQFGFPNIMQVPGLTKIVVNMGVGEAARDSKLIEGALRDLTAITGQKPQVTKARKSIAQFKLREGMPIGAHVTLRGDRLWEAPARRAALARRGRRAPRAPPAPRPPGPPPPLRAARMWESPARLLSVALPRIRGFRGLSAKQFDG